MDDTSRSPFTSERVKAMTENILRAWQIDIAARSNGLHRKAPAGCKVNAQEIVPGIVTRTPTSRSQHFRCGMRIWSIPLASGLNTDRTIVISGDTIPTQALIDHSRGLRPSSFTKPYSMANLPRGPSTLAGIPAAGPHIDI